MHRSALSCRFVLHRLCTVTGEKLKIKRGDLLDFPTDQALEEKEKRATSSRSTAIGRPLPSSAARTTIVSDSFWEK
jgi:hypothetical protein